MALNTPIDVKFGEDGDKDLDKFVFTNVTALKNSYSTLHTTEVPKWRRLTKGIPQDKERNFPWPGASNVIVQVIGENVDTIKALQLGTIYEIMPLWPVGLIGDFDETEEAEKQRSITERFMDHMGLSKTELDLYRVESRAAYDIAALGSVVIKLPWLTQVQQVVTGLDAAGQLIEQEITKYDGPRPEKLAFEDWAATPSAQTWEDAKFKYHEIRLTKDQCEYRVHKGHFDKDAWAEIKNSPDLEGLTEEEEKQLRESNFESPMQSKELARWRFYECWFEYTHNNKIYNIIYILHYDKIVKRMKAVFNFYPKNEEPFEFGRLGYDDDNLIGYGFAKMGEMYQEDISTKHNQRNDNHTLCNTSVLLAGNNPRVDAGISLFPMAVLPFHPDEVAIEQLGAPDQSSVQEENLTLQLAKARFGTDMLSAEGNGSGGVDRKGNYSSMGSFSIMQQGARRINVNITDFRYLHLNIGQKAARQYAYFGVGEDRYKYMGKEGAKYLRMAMESMKQGRLELPIKAATASINREIEKQTGMLFTNVMQRHYGAIAQILQGVTNQSVPEPLREYLMGSISALSYIMSKLLRAFGYDDVLKLQPELAIIDKLKGANNGQQTIPSSQGGTPPSNGASSIQEAQGPAFANTGTSGAPLPASTGSVLH